MNGSDTRKVLVRLWLRMLVEVRNYGMLFSMDSTYVKLFFGVSLRKQISKTCKWKIFTNIFVKEPNKMSSLHVLKGGAPLVRQGPFILGGNLARL